MGKSAFAESLSWLGARECYSFNRSKPAEAKPRVIVAFSPEQSAQTWLERQAVRMDTRLDGEAYRKGEFTEEQWETLFQVTERLRVAPILINDNPAISVAEIAEQLRDASAEYDIRLVTLDFLQRLKEIQLAGEGRFQKIGDVAEALADIGKDVTMGHGPHKVPVPMWVLSQVKAPSGERARDDRPVMTDLYGSRQLEAAARCVMFLHRQDYYYQSTPGYVPNGEAELIVDKNNNGPTGIFKLTFDAKKVSFYERTAGNV
jgi:replicative DNA helicase